METRRVARGDVLLKEGDPADRVFRLRSGDVEIVRQVGEQTVVMGAVGAGQFVGEMAAVERRPRHGATVRAASDAEVEVLTLPEFLDRIDHAPGVAGELIERLSRRLHAANERIIRDEANGEASARTTATAAQKLRIAARSPWLLRQTPEPIAVDHLPFVVGRRHVAGERPAAQRPDMLLDDHEPFRLSRDHFMIVGDDGRYFVRDMSSTLGTVVNGEPIGEHFRKDEVLLHDGENEVVAGGAGSRFVFSVNVG